jgi:hypothetical protein
VKGMGKAELEGHVMFRSAGVRRGMSRMAGQKRKGQLWTAMVRAWGFGQLDIGRSVPFGYGGNWRGPMR